MNSTIDGYQTNYDPIRQTNLIQPIDTNQFSSNWINYLYREEQLTQDEYQVLDYIGTTMKLKDGSVIMSFQGLKRLISIHQARLTKAINRLIRKEMLQKIDGGYTLTEKGIEVFSRLYGEYRKNENILPQKLYSHVAEGIVQGPELSNKQYNAIEEGLNGRWFGNFRFTSKVDFENSFELCWISTNGSTSASLIVGPRNNIRLAVSAPIYSESQSELQLLINHISQSLESAIDAPVIINNHSVYENDRKISQKIDDAQIPYAG